ncbi:hypothetical protein A4G19_01580 [Pasteurellaceae bacterium Macca]|nr:hypothetical protein [Pasteurellaceae bacterium Macca]
MKKTHSRLGVLGSLLFHSAIFSGVWAIMQLPKPERTVEVNSISLEMLAARLEQPQVAVAPEPTLDAEPEAQSEPESAEPEVKEEVVEKEEAKQEESNKVEEPIPETVLPPKPLAKPLEKPKEKEKPKEPPKEKRKEKIKEKPKEKPPEKIKEKPKEKPKEKVKEKTKEPKKDPVKPIKALEAGSEVKQGIVAKAIPQVAQGVKAQAGIVNGSAKGNALGQSASGGAEKSNAASSSNSNEINAYKALLQRMLQQRANNAYPQREKLMRRTGTVTLALTVSPSGQVMNVRVANSSGNSNLDAAAVKAAQSTFLNRAPPAGFPSSLTVPVRFSLQ